MVAGEGHHGDAHVGDMQACAGWYYNSPDYRTETEPLPRSVPIGFIDEAPALDIRVFSSRCDMTLPDLAGRWMRWPRESTGSADHYLIFADLREAGAALLMAHGLGSNGDWFPPDVIQLSQTDNKGKPRWYMHCPVLGTRCQILYYRNGRFASAKAQRLVHRSQRAVPAKATLQNGR